MRAHARILQKRSKLKFLSALICDEIDRMQRELNDLEYAIRTFRDVEVSREQQQNKKFPKLVNLKDILMIELSGGGKRKKRSALPDNQTLINGFFQLMISTSQQMKVVYQWIITSAHLFFNFENNRTITITINYYPCVTNLPLCSCDWRASW